MDKGMDRGQLEVSDHTLKIPKRETAVEHHSQRSQMLQDLSGNSGPLQALSSSYPEKESIESSNPESPHECNTIEPENVKTKTAKNSTEDKEDMRQMNYSMDKSENSGHEVSHSPISIDHRTFEHGTEVLKEPTYSEVLAQIENNEIPTAVITASETSGLEEREDEESMETDAIQSESLNTSKILHFLSSPPQQGGHSDQVTVSPQPEESHSFQQTVLTQKTEEAQIFQQTLQMEHPEELKSFRQTSQTQQPKESQIFQQTPQTQKLEESQSSTQTAQTQSAEVDQTLQAVHASLAAADSPAHNEDAQIAEESLKQEAEESTRYRFTPSSVPCLVWETRDEYTQVPAENFIRGCKWSPDGSTLAVNSNDNCLRLYSQVTFADDLPESHRRATEVKKEGSQIYDFCWCPRTESADDLLLLTTCSGIPIHMWSASGPRPVASYRAFDQNDEITAAYSLAFSSDGSKIYAGYKKTIRIFDTNRPGRMCTTVPTFKRKAFIGQTGLISCFADGSKLGGFFVAGSYSRSVGIYDCQTNEVVNVLEAHRGGVTQVQLSPDGIKLYSGGRKDPEILCWDLRRPGSPLFSMLRDVKTNQRMQFDLTESGQYLCSGNHDGTVTVWDTTGSTQEVDGDAFLQPQCQFKAHNDCVNAISFQHQNNLLATGSGQRHFEAMDRDSEEEMEERDQQVPDFSLKLWNVAKDPPFVDISFQ